MARIYGENTTLSEDAVANFWNKKSASEGLKAVLLGKTADNSEQTLRNNHENHLLHELLKKYLGNTKKPNILDIGCGIGRWCANFKDEFASYCGIDGSSKFIEEDKALYTTSQCEFICEQLKDLKAQNFSKTFDLVIITGVLMYLNDDIVDKLLHELAQLVNPHGVIYIQESVSLLDERLTLKDFFSKELQSSYNAIYRMISEYENSFMKQLSNFTVLEKGLMLDDKKGARSETNAEYWFLKKLA